MTRRRAAWPGILSPPALTRRTPTKRSALRLRRRRRTPLGAYAPSLPCAPPVDESSFSARRVRGKKGAGAGGQIIVFGILERQGKVHAEIVPDASKKPLQAVIRSQVALDSIIHSDSWRGYNGLVDMGYQKHLCVHS